MTYLIKIIRCNRKMAFLNIQTLKIQALSEIVVYVHSPHSLLDCMANTNIIFQNFDYYDKNKSIKHFLTKKMYF